MPIYTSEEIVEDILKTEEVRLNIDCNVYSGVLYSQIHSKSSDSSTVDQLKEKIINFIDEHCYPSIQEQPDEREGWATVYSVHTEQSSAAVIPKYSKKVGVCKEGDMEALSELLEDLQVGSVFILNSEGKLLIQYHRQTH